MLIDISRLTLKKYFFKSHRIKELVAADLEDELLWKEFLQAIFCKQDHTENQLRQNYSVQQCSVLHLQSAPTIYT